MKERSKPNKESYGWNDTVVAFRLTTETLEMLRHAARELKVKVFIAESLTDLIAVPAFMVVVDPGDLSIEEREEFETWIEFTIGNISPREYGVLFARIPSFQTPTAFSKFVLRTPDYLDADYFKLKLLNKRMSSRGHQRNIAGLERRIFRLLRILKVLRVEGVLYPEDLINEFQMCRKTLQRDIAILQAMYELIEWDPVRRGYVLADPDGLSFTDLSGAFPVSKVQNVK